MTDRIFGIVVAGLLLLMAGQLWARSVDRKALEAESEWQEFRATLMPIADAARRSRAVLLAANEQAVISAAIDTARANERARLAAKALQDAHDVSVAVDSTEAAVRASLHPEQVQAFEGFMATIEARQEAMEIAVAEAQAATVEAQQASRTLFAANELLVVQVRDREAQLQAEFEAALLKSEQRGDAWQRAANPGFAIELWRDMPRLVVAVGAGWAAAKLL